VARELSEFGKLPPIPARLLRSARRNRTARLRDEPRFPRFTLRRDEDPGK